MKILIPLLIITNLITASFAFDLNRNSLEIEQKLDEARAIETQLMRAYESLVFSSDVMEKKLFEKEIELKLYLLEKVELESSWRE